MIGSRPTVGPVSAGSDRPSGGVAGLEDRWLVHAARSHPSAFSAIFDRYHDSVRALIQRVCGPAEAEDLVQETFIRAFSGLDTFEFREDSSLRTWLHRIAVNTAINALRARDLRERHESWSMDEHVVTEDGRMSRRLPDVSKEPGRIAVRDEIRLLVYQAIRSLSPKHRQALVLIDLEQLQYSEAAAIIGCRIGTLKSRLSRARDALAATIRPRGNWPDTRPPPGEPTA